MSKCKVAALWATAGCVVGAYKSIQAFHTGFSASDCRGVLDAGVRVRGNYAVSGGVSSAARKDGDKLSSSAASAVIATIGGAAIASAVAVARGANRSTASNVPRQQASRSIGSYDTFVVGQAVEVKIWNGEMQPGVVTSVSPLMIKPKGWAESHSFETVMAVAEVKPPAFVEAMRAPTVDSGKFDPSRQLGVTEPLGFFDPLGLSATMDEKTFRHVRAAEIKHGRVAMLASLGCVVQHHIAIPGFEDVPRGLGAFETFPASPIGLILVALASGYVEWFLWKENDDRLPGDFGNPWCPIEGFEVTDDLRNKEINNGRLAMISIMGIIAAELASGRDGVEQIFGV